jgi:CheY-like chemotaxis protein
MSSVETPVQDFSHRLLVVDDELSVLRFVKTILNRAQYEAVTCDNVGEAINLLQRQAFDCVITDAAMPGTDGYELVKLIRKDRNIDLPVLMLTKKRHRQDVKKAVEAGITDYIVKPIDEHLLLDKVELCLKKGISLGKRQIPGFIAKEEQSAHLLFQSEIIFVNEACLVLKLPFPIPFDIELRMQAPLFQTIGIKPPLIKLISCNEIPASLEASRTTYEAKFSYIGLPDTDFEKLRAWFNWEDIRRRK